MIYQVDNILRDVRVCIDENTTSEQLELEADTETLALDEIIRSKISEAAKNVILSTHVSMLGAGHPMDGASIVWSKAKGHGPGYFILPDDFLRLVTFQMSDWDYPLNTPITEDDPLYERQHSRFAGIRGNPSRPVIALANHPAGLALEFFSCNEGSSVFIKSLRYVRKPVIYKGRDDKGVEVEMIEFPDRLYEAVKYMCSYYVARTFGMANADFFSESVKTYL